MNDVSFIPCVTNEENGGGSHGGGLPFPPPCTQISNETSVNESLSHKTQQLEHFKYTFTMPALSFLNSTVPLHPEPYQLPFDIRTNDQASRFGSLALSVVTVSLTAASLVIACLHLRLKVRAPNDTPTSVEGDALGRESIILEDIIVSPGRNIVLEYG